MRKSDEYLRELKNVTETIQEKRLEHDKAYDGNDPIGVSKIEIEISSLMKLAVRALENFNREVRRESGF